MKRIMTQKLFLKRLIILAWMLSCLSPIRGQEVQKVGTSAAAFLRIPVGARAIAMGSAFTALADDGTAMFWNPGNMARQSQNTLFVHHSPWLPGLDHTYFGFSFPMTGVGVIGVNVVSLRTDEMEITTLDAPMGTGETYTAASTAVGLSYARSLTDRFSIGGNVKYVQERIFNSTASGVAFDVGTLFVTPFKDVRFGVRVSNVGTSMKMNGEDLNAYVDVAPNQEGNNDEIVSQIKTDAFDMPIILQLGLAWDLKMGENCRMTFACDGVNPNDNAQSLNVGYELALLKESVFLRSGYNELFLKDREKGLTAGAGLNFPSIQGMRVSINYAYQDFKYLNAVNHYSIQIQF